MTLGRRVAVGFVLMLASLGLAIALATWWGLIPDAEQEEREARLIDLERVQAAIRFEQVRLGRTALDWGQWDDTYRYVATPHAGYEDDNLTAAWAEKIDVDLLVVTDATGRVVGRFVAPRLEASRELSVGAVWSPDCDAAPMGLVQLDGGLSILAAAPILPSDGVGAPRGVFYAGKLLGADVVARLARHTRVELSIGARSGPAVAPSVDLSSSERAVAHRVLSVSRASGEQEHVALMVTSDRRHYHQAIWGALRLGVILFGVASLLALLTFWYVHRTLVRPMVALCHQADEFGNTWRVEAITPTTRADELGAVARSLAALARRVDAGRSALDRERLRMETAALTDPLTQLPNRRAALRVLKAAESWAVPPMVTLLAILDLDHFKAVNDSAGHDVGDRVLAEAARLIRECMRDQDFAARTGGEEFVVFARVPDYATALAMVERLRARFEPHPFQGRETTHRVTLSAGFVVVAAEALNAPWEDSERLLKLADLALYDAKTGGRNRWVGYSLTERLTPEDVPAAPAELRRAVGAGTLIAHRYDLNSEGRPLALARMRAS